MQILISKICGNDPVNYADPSGHGVVVGLLLATLSGVIAFVADALGQVVFDGATWSTIDWRQAGISGISAFVSNLIPGSGFASRAAQAVVSSFVENGLNAIFLGKEFDLGLVARDIIVSIVSDYTVEGLTLFTSKLTSKIINVAPTYSQYQHYYRNKGHNYSRQEMYAIMKKHRTVRSIIDKSIEKSFDFLFSFLTHPI